MVALTFEQLEARLEFICSIVSSIYCIVFSTRFRGKPPRGSQRDLFHSRRGTELSKAYPDQGQPLVLIP
ncbi:hypothetical protein QC763_0007160 [Podospora pseudopauciseta]|uniref:Uncharacterized protein n=1 Tax=Podospora pseudopauciseta TaxID=2093780 RepID=A0ABR0HXY5_9PEZI|nr:hypothetical protein QC763_0007160 [Podospora pseudopauciseta]